MQQQPRLKVEEVAAECNNNEREYPSHLCVHELFERQAKLHSDSIALRFDGQTLTYGDLNQRSNQLARCLRERGVGPEVLVGLCVERSLDMVVGLLGILKSGGAYVPIDPGYPKDRIAYIMEDAHAPVLITQNNLLSTLPEHGAQIILLDKDWDQIARKEPGNLGRTSEANNLAYVIYTSGSTGLPKGVEVEHRSVINFLCAMQEEPGITPEDVLAAVTTICFDIAGLEIYLPLVTGASVVIVSREEAADGRKLQARLRQAGVSVVQATPATWRLLLEADWPGDKNIKILCGGEAFPRELADKLLPRCRSLWNMYGPTETTIWSAVYRVSSSSEATVPIGRPIANTQFYIVNDCLEQVPLGQQGQLLIGGEGLARGYRNRPDLTNEKFISDHFRALTGARLYKTGDLARYLPDGSIAFLGRLDQQVKIRGYRIELGEVEAVLATHPSVRQCVVSAHEVGGEKTLVAYIVPRHGKPAGSVLREFLKAKLPDYMLPAAFVVLPALPLTANGKIDRKALPAPTRENSAIESEFAPPRDDLERKLVSIWESVLKISPIGIADNIFDLGVDSLLAAELFARIEKSIGKHLPPAPLFQAPTVQSLAVLLRQGENQHGLTSLVTIQPGGAKTPFFCVHGGAGTVLLFNSLARHLAPERPVYGLQARGLYGRELPHTNIEQMAAHYVREIRAVQSRGPYLVGGWCFGGLVAYEITSQLQRVGETVDALVMFDAPSSPDYYRPKTDASGTQPSASQRTSLQSKWQQFWSLPIQAKLNYVLRRVRGRLVRRKRILYRYLRGVSRRTLCRIYITLRRPLPDNIRNYYFLYISTIAEQRYQPKLYSGDMLVFRNQGPYPDPNLGWSRFVTGTIESHEIQVSIAHHRALMQEPAVLTVVEILKRYLARKSGVSSSRTQAEINEALSGSQTGH